MANLISTGLKASLEDARDSIFDSFSRPIVCWKTPEKTILSTDQNYNFAYDNPDYSNDNTADLVTYSGISGQFMACITYNHSLDPTFSTQGNFSIAKDNGLTRVKVKSGDYNTFIKDSIDIQFDSYNFKIIKTERPHGVFSPKYYTLYLEFQS